MADATHSGSSSCYRVAKLRHFLAYVERFIEASGAVRAIVVARAGAGVLATLAVRGTLALDSDEP